MTCKLFKTLSGDILLAEVVKETLTGDIEVQKCFMLAMIPIPNGGQQLGLVPYCPFTKEKNRFVLYKASLIFGPEIANEELSKAWTEETTNLILPTTKQIITG